MNAKLVEASLRRHFWPVLREEGFRVSGRNAYREAPLGFDVVTMQALGGRLGHGAFAFAINLGIRLRGVPPEHAAVRLREYHCELRRRLHRRVADEHRAQYPDIWYATADGKNVAALAIDAAEVFAAEALPWFARWTDPQEILRTLLGDDTMSADGTWMPGAVASPRRLEVTGYFAETHGERTVALEQLERALKAYRDVDERTPASLRLTPPGLEGDVKRLQSVQARHP